MWKAVTSIELQSSTKKQIEKKDKRKDKSTFMNRNLLRDNESYVEYIEKYLWLNRHNCCYIYKS